MFSTYQVLCCSGDYLFCLHFVTSTCAFYQGHVMYMLLVPPYPYKTNVVYWLQPIDGNLICMSLFYFYEHFKDLPHIEMKTSRLWTPCYVGLQHRSCSMFFFVFFYSGSRSRESVQESLFLASLTKVNWATLASPAAFPGWTNYTA